MLTSKQTNKHHPLRVFFFTFRLSDYHFLDATSILLFIFYYSPLFLSLHIYCFVRMFHIFRDGGGGGGGAVGGGGGIILIVSTQQFPVKKGKIQDNHLPSSSSSSSSSSSFS